MTLLASRLVRLGDQILTTSRTHALWKPLEYEQMIDRESRDVLAENLRQLVTGQLTNYKFERAVRLSNLDRGINRIYQDLAWHLYDDYREYKLRGENSLSDEARTTVTRAILFLYSDFEYEWPIYPENSLETRRSLLKMFLTGLLVFLSGLPAWVLIKPTSRASVLVLILCGLCSVLGLIMIWHGKEWIWYPRFKSSAEEQQRHFQSFGDFTVWPFRRREDFENAKTRPRLLSGLSWPR
jgi:hypothetical protein